MPDIKIRELPSKFKEVKKEKSPESGENEEEQASLEAIIQELRARAISKNQAMSRSMPTRAVNPTLKTGNIAQIVSGPPAPVTKSPSETEKDSRPVVYETREKSKYEASSNSSDKKYDTQNSERKYSSDSSSRKTDDSRRVSPVLGDTTSGNTNTRGIFGTPQEQRGIQFSDHQDNRRDYEVNSLAENQDRRRSRRL